MKTFKLASVEISTKDVYTSIALIDGLIINQEDENQRWLLELFVEKKYFDLFSSYLHDSTLLQVNARITRLENSPAQLEGMVITLLELENQLSVLFDCKMKI